MAASTAFFLADLPMISWPDFLCVGGVVLLIAGAVRRHGGEEINDAMKWGCGTLITVPALFVAVAALKAWKDLPLPMILGVLAAAISVPVIWMLICNTKPRPALWMQWAGAAISVLALGWIVWSLLQNPPPNFRRQ